MKKIISLISVFAAAAFICGCSQNVKLDEKLTAEQAKAEAAKMDAKQLQAQVAAYNKLIDSKLAEKARLQNKIAELGSAKKIEEAKKLEEQAMYLWAGIKKAEADKADAKQLEANLKTLEQKIKDLEESQKKDAEEAKKLAEQVKELEKTIKNIYAARDEFVSAEAAKMDKAALEAKIDCFNKLVTDKTVEKDALAKKIKDMTEDQKKSDEGKQLQEKAKCLDASLDDAFAVRGVYVDALDKIKEAADKAWSEKKKADKAAEEKKAEAKK